MTVTLTVEEIELIQLAMECLYSELPEYSSINEKLRGMRKNLLSKDADEYREYTLQDVLNEADVPKWVRWVVVTRLGEVVMCELEPVPHSDSKLWEFAGGYELVNRVVPPIYFTKCIWEIKE